MACRHLLPSFGGSHDHEQLGVLEIHICNLDFCLTFSSSLEVPCLVESQWPRLLLPSRAPSATVPPYWLSGLWVTRQTLMFKVTKPHFPWA